MSFEIHLKWLRWCACALAITEAALWNESNNGTGSKRCKNWLQCLAFYSEHFVRFVLCRRLRQFWLHCSSSTRASFLRCYLYYQGIFRFSSITLTLTQQHCDSHSHSLYSTVIYTHTHTRSTALWLSLTLTWILISFYNLCFLTVYITVVYGQNFNEPISLFKDRDNKFLPVFVLS